MRIIVGLDAFHPGSRRTAVAIGNFDGLHLGHRRILRTLGRLSRQKKLRSLVLTFDPHPERVFGRTRTLMIQTIAQRLESLRRAGVDSVLVTGFDRGFSGLSPAKFVTTVLRDRLAAEAVVVGDNFRFGRDRAGTIKDLKTMGAAAGLTVRSVPPVNKNGRVLSSSLIRSLLERGRVEEAARYLGRPYAVAGRVVHGRKVGRSIGFPTANLRTENEILPEGVFITLARVGRALYPSVANVGVRPTFGRGGLSLETVLLDSDRDLYGRTLEVSFLKKLRSERKFSSPETLARQIAKDIEAARAYFRAAKRLPC